MKKKATKKDLEISIYELHMRINQINHLMNGIAEMLNKFIDFTGKSKKFYAKLQAEIDTEKKKDVKNDKDKE